MQFSVSGWCTFIFKKELLLTTDQCYHFLWALSVGKVVNAFGHANSLRFDTIRSKLKRSAALPCEPKKALQFADYLTNFDKFV